MNTTECIDLILVEQPYFASIAWMDDSMKGQEVVVWRWAWQLANFPGQFSRQVAPVIST